MSSNHVSRNSVLFNQTTYMIVPNQINLGTGKCYIDKSSGNVKIVHIMLGVTQKLVLVVQLAEKQFDVLFPNGRKVTHTKNNVLLSLDVKSIVCLS